ncbi:hypothetical protein AFLA_013383 [Aspergillus flavus NRRL3357]|nr:hypothetical protein AFLA_013383 [Aspergillus flavus NRRL3357]
MGDNSMAFVYRQIPDIYFELSRVSSYQYRSSRLSTETCWDNAKKRRGAIPTENENINSKYEMLPNQAG